MTTTDRPPNPSRRRFLLGAGAVPALWALSPLAAQAAEDTSASTPPRAAQPSAPQAECLADLINQGVVRRADLVAG